MASPPSKPSRRAWPVIPAQPTRARAQPDIASHDPRDAGAGPACQTDTTRVIKRLKPGQPGTRKLHGRYGPALVCVRYREDLVTGGTRYTTVELVIDQRNARRQPLVRVDIRFDDAETRRQAMMLGAEWNEAQKTWRMPRRAAIQLGLLRNKRKP
jgi:hypothetical protein